MSSYSAPSAALVADTFARLDAITDPGLAAVLRLHSRRPRGAEWVCEGCDADGYDVCPPGWPCRTIEVVIEHQLGVVLPPGRPIQQWGLVERPLDGSLDALT